MERERWRIEVLGRAAAVYGSNTYERFRERRVLLLLAMLCLETREFIPRSELIERLWPEEPPDAARNRFRVTLHYARKLLSSGHAEAETVVRATGSAVSLVSGAIVCDATEFLEAVHQAAGCSNPTERVSLLETASALYKGEVLPGYDDLWSEEKRAELSALHFQTLRDLIRLLLPVAGGAERAIPYARRAVAADPYDEEAHCDLIRACGIAGRISEALRCYGALENLLDRDLGAKPSAQARKLAEMLRSRLGHGIEPLHANTLHSSTACTADAIPSAARLAAIESPAGEQAAAPEIERLYLEGKRRLPVHLTRFFGREKERDALVNLLTVPTPARFVTLTGPGGVGKSRLASETAQYFLDHYTGRVFYVPLADIFAVQQVGGALLQALGQPPDPHHDALSHAQDLLEVAPSLLVLDNLEQLLPDLRELVLHLLERTPTLQCLATSRCAVGIDGEWEVVVTPLPAPTGDESLAELLQMPGVELFADRARAARFGFEITERNRCDVASLCAVLEGLPLALELAGARVRSMSVKEMCAEMDRILEWLVDDRGVKSVRHQSLRAVIHWSYRGLPPRLQRLFETMSVFVGGFTVSAAHVLCEDTFPSRSEVFADLRSLEAASLIAMHEDENGYMRFRMLETIRAFAWERAAREGRNVALRLRHFRWCLEFAEQARDGDGRALAREAANLHAALHYSLSGAGGLQAEGTRLAALLNDYWLVHGPAEEGRAFCARILDLDLPDESKMDAYVGLAALMIAQGDLREATEVAGVGLLRAHALRDREHIAGCQMNLGVAACRLGDYADAETRLTEARTIFHEREDQDREAQCLIHAGMVAWYQARHAEARALCEEALAIYTALGSERGIADCLSKLGNIARDGGDLETGRELLQQALARFRSLQAPRDVGAALHGLGLIARFEHKLKEAASYFKEAKAQFERIGAQGSRAGCLRNLAEVLLLEGRTDEGAALLEEALASFQRLGDRRGIAVSLQRLGVVAEKRGEMETALERLREAVDIDRSISNPLGAANDLNQLARLHLNLGEPDRALLLACEALETGARFSSLPVIGQSLLGVAAMHHQLGDSARAARLAGAAESLYRVRRIVRLREDASWAAELKVAIEQRIGVEAAQEQWENGAGLSIEAAICEAGAAANVPTSESLSIRLSP